MNRVLLIPSAKLLPPELESDFGRLPTGMIPLRGRPAMHYILERYAERGFRGVVAVGDKCWVAAEYLEQHPELAAAPAMVGDTKSLAETVLLAWDQIGSADELIINFADTLIDNAELERDAFLFDRREDLYRWTAFSLDDSGAIDQIIDK